MRLSRHRKRKANNVSPTEGIHPQPVYIVEPKRTLKQQIGKACAVVAGVIVLLFILGALEGNRFDDFSCVQFGNRISCSR